MSCVRRTVRHHWLAATAALSLVIGQGVVSVLPAEPEQVAAARVAGRLDAITLTPHGEAILTINGRRIHAGADVPWAFPGQQITAREVFAQAPAACVARGETGLLASDECLGSRTANVSARKVAVTLAAAEGGLATASSITVPGGGELLSGAVTFVNPSEGYLRVAGPYGTDQGTMVRINDPGATQSMQTGAGCGREANCSPDVRFRIRATPPSVVFTTGRPACIPGPVDQLCPPPSREMPDGVAAAVQKGDHVTAAGSYEQTDDARVFVAEAMKVKSAHVQ
jgi:hypothetical protein